MGKKANAGRFERGYQKVTEKSYQLDFARTRKAAENQFLEVPLCPEHGIRGHLRLTVFFLIIAASPFDFLRFCRYIR